MQANRFSLVVVALLFSFVIRLSAAPTINTPPSPATVIVGQGTTFTVGATGSGTLSYLWSASTDSGVTWNTLSNKPPSNNVTTATLSINAPAYALNGALLRCAVTDTNGTTVSSSATLTVTSPAPFLILADPAGKSAFQGDVSATYTVVATATGANPAPTYQWLLSTDGGNTFNNVTDGVTYLGSATAILSITDPYTSFTGGTYNNNAPYKYRCNVTSGAYTIPKDATLSIYPTPSLTPTVTINGTASPTSVATNSTAPITVQVSSINTGGTIRVDRYADLNGNGLIDPGEPLVQSFTVTDGSTASYGGVTDPNIPGDTDATANGTVTANFYLGNLSEFARTAGAYILRVVSPTGAFRPFPSAVFTLTQPAQAQSVSGTVMNGASPVPYAQVGLLINSSGGGDFVGGTVANGSGNFTIQAPPGNYSLFPLAAGYVGGMTSLPALTSGVSLTGQNVSLTPAAYMQTLKLKDQSSGDPLRGVQIFFQSNTAGVTIANTDNNGVATAGALAATDWSYDLSGASIAGLGYLRPNSNSSNGKTLYTTNGSISLQAANALIYGTLKDNAGTPNPIANVNISASDQNNNYSSDANTDAGGNYYLPVYGNGGQWYVNVDNKNPIFGTTYSLPPSANPVVAANNNYVVNFVAPLVTAHISGTVTNADNANLPVSGAQIDLFSVVGSNNNFVTSVTTDASGNFSFGLNAGNWSISLDSNYADSNNLVVPRLSYPTVVDGNNFTAQVYAVKNGTGTINGQILDFAGAGVSNGNVNGSALIGGITYTASGQTNGSGNYSFPVINGTWSLNAGANNGLNYPPHTVNAIAGSNPWTFNATVFNGAPGNPTVNAGTPASFFVSTNAPGSPTLQWLVSTDSGATFNPVPASPPYSGTTTNNLNISPTSVSMTGYQYRLSATFLYNLVSYTRTSNIGTLTVTTVAPSYSLQPSSHSVNASSTGGTTIFGVAVNGAPTPTIQWQVSTDSGATWPPLSDGGYYSGTATATLTITNPDFTLNNYQYRTVATNAGGSLTSNAATLTVNRNSQFVSFSGSTVTLNSPVTLSPSVGSGLTNFNFTVTGTPTASYTLTGNSLTLTSAGSVTVQATQPGNNYYASASNSATFTVPPQPVTINFGNLSQTYDGTPKSANVTTTPLGVSISVTYDAISTPPTNAGNHAINVTVTDPNYFLSGSGSATLNIALANQSINFSVADQTYRTTPIPLNASVNSPLAITFSVFSGPANVTGNMLTLTGLGVVTVRAAQPGDSNHNAAPNVDRSFNVSKGAATVTLGNLGAAYDGSPKSASATTNPNGLTVGFTYNGSGTAPTAAGTYAVVGTISDTLYQGSASSFLVISPPPGPGVEVTDGLFTRPQFRRSSLPGRIVADQVSGSGKIYAAFSNGNTVTGVNNQRIGPIVRLNADGSTDSSFNPGGFLADVWAIVPLANGQILVGGAASNESTESGLPLYRVFRLNGDGSRDFAYNSPVFLGIPRFMTLQPDGRLLVAPSNNNSGNGGISTLARLNLDGTLDGTFTSPVFDVQNGSPNFIFANVLVDTNGKIIIGGTFTTVNGTARQGVARLNADGSLDTSFVPSGFTFFGVTSTSNDQIRGLGIQTQGANAGKIVVAGKRLIVGGIPRTVIRLNPDGSLDNTFTLLNVGQVEGPNGVRPRLLNMLANDQFQIVSDSVTRFTTNGSIDVSYARPFLNIETFWMDSLADGSVLVPSDFGMTVGGTPVSGPFRLTSSGALDGTFAPGAFQTEFYPGNFAIQPDGRVLAWGNFDTVNATARHGMARINTDGSLDTFNLSGVANLYSIQGAALLANGQILAATQIGTYQTNLSGGISRFNADGTVDSSFTLDPLANPGNLHVLPDGRLLTWNQDVNTLLNGGNLFFKRLAVSGAIDNTFTGLGATSFGTVNRDGSNFITEIVQGSFSIAGHYADGRLLAISTIANGSYPVGATSLNMTVTRLNADGTLDTGFTAPSVPAGLLVGFTPFLLDPVKGTTNQYTLRTTNGSPFNGVVPQPDGSVLVYGSFTSLGGNPAPGIARLTNTGAFDTGFSVGTGPQLVGQPGRTPQVEHIDLAPDGRYWVTGLFDTFGGVPAPGIVRLNTDGTVDNLLAPGIAYRSYLGNGTKVGFGSSGEVYVAGTFGQAFEPFPSGLTRLIGTVAPAITVQPLSQSVATGANVTFSVGVTPGLTVAYQWFRNSVAITGATNSTLTLTNVQAGDAASYTVAVTNALTFATSNAAVLTVGPSFSSWQTLKFTAGELGNATISGPNAVYGQDSLRNLVKYALGLEPKQNITTGLPVASTTGANWVYTYTRPSNINDVTYSVEISTDLVSWSSSGVTLTLQSSSGGIDTWQATYPLASTPKIFFRLNVTQ